MGIKGTTASDDYVCYEVRGRCCQRLSVAGEIVARMAYVLSKAVQAKVFLISFIQEEFGEVPPSMKRHSSTSVSASVADLQMFSAPSAGCRTDRASRYLQTRHSMAFGNDSRWAIERILPKLSPTTLIAMSTKDRGPFVPRGLKEGYGRRRLQSALLSAVRASRVMRYSVNAGPDSGSNMTDLNEIEKVARLSETATKRRQENQVYSV